MQRKVAVLTREYPPEVYGGAGTHVEYLVRELRGLLTVTVHCWGSPRVEPGVESYRAWEALSEPKPEAAPAAPATAPAKPSEPEAKPPSSEGGN